VGVVKRKVLYNKENTNFILQGGLKPKIYSKKLMEEGELGSEVSFNKAHYYTQYAASREIISSG